MTTAAHPLRLTYEDLASLPEDGRRHELIDGVHHVTPAPSTRHQRILGSLFWQIRSYLEGRPVGEVFLAPVDVVLTESDVVEPDLVYVSRERAHIVTEKNISGAPDIVVEVLSEATRRRDERLKRDLYDRCGVGEYWIVDPEVETIKLFRREGAGFGRPLELSLESGDSLVCPRLPDLSIPLSAIFPRA